MGFLFGLHLSLISHWFELTLASFKCSHFTCYVHGEFLHFSQSLNIAAFEAAKNVKVHDLRLAKNLKEKNDIQTIWNK